MRDTFSFLLGFFSFSGKAVTCFSLSLSFSLLVVLEKQRNEIKANEGIQLHTGINDKIRQEAKEVQKH